MIRIDDIALSGCREIIKYIDHHFGMAFYQFYLLKGVSFSIILRAERGSREIIRAHAVCVIYDYYCVSIDFKINILKNKSISPLKLFTSVYYAYIF